MTLRNSSEFLRTWPIAVALAAVAAVPAWPAAAKAKVESLSEAESVAETAARRFKEGDFELAAKLFDRAYELAKKPTLLFNAGRAYEQAGQREAAVARYEAYVQVETDPGGREEAKLRAARLREQLARDGKAAQPVAAKQESPKSVEVKAEPAKPEPSALEPAKPAPAQPAPAQPELAKKQDVVPPAHSAVQTSRVGPWVAVAGTAALTLAGAVTWGLAVRADHTLQSAVDSRTATGITTGITQVNAFADHDSIGKRKVTGTTLMAVGGAGLAGSLVWLLLGGSTTQAAWIAAPGPDGVTLAGRF